MYMTINKKQESIFFIILLIFSVLLIGSDAFRDLKLYDEGVTVYGALQVMKGYLPYRDFWTVYMPGHFYLYALVFKIFGATIYVERITSVILLVGISVSMYAIARRVLPSLYALLVFFFASVWFSTFDFFGYILYPTLLFGLLSIYCFVLFLQYKNARTLWWAGMLIGLTALFRHDFGVYIIMAEIGILAGFSVTRTTALSYSFKKIFWPGFTKLIAGTALVFLPAAIFFLVKVPFHELYESLILFPVDIYPNYRKLPFPAPFISYQHYQLEGSGSFGHFIQENLDRLYLYFPLIIYAVFAIQIFIQYKKRLLTIESDRFWLNILMLFLGLLFFTKVIVRSVYLHLMPTYAIAILVFFMILYYTPKTLNKPVLNRVAVAFLVLLAIPTLVRPLWGQVVNLTINKETVAFEQHRGHKIQWDVRGIAYQQVINYVDSLVPKDDKIFVGSVRHDRIFTNDVMFYFLSERPSATKYAELHPGVATTEAVQKEIVTELRQADVQIIVLTDETRVESENMSGVSSGVTLLDDYIREHYAPKKTFGNYTVWQKNNAQRATMQMHQE